MASPATTAAREDLLSATVEVLADTLGMRDGATGAHSDRVVALAPRLGRRLGLGEGGMRELGYAARVHDIGKLGVPDAILQKPGPLDRRESRLLQEHPRWGADLVRRIPGLQRVAMIVRHHHERFDGRGYPDGLAGAETLLESRILAVADAYAAMTENRPYRRALSEEQAAAELQRGRATQFDPLVVEALELTPGGRALLRSEEAVARTLGKYPQDEGGGMTEQRAHVI